jgi:hypothetical protein
MTFEHSGVMDLKVNAAQPNRNLIISMSPDLIKASI